MPDPHARVRSAKSPTGSPNLHADAQRCVPWVPHPPFRGYPVELFTMRIHAALSTELAKRSSIDLSALIAPSPNSVVLAYIRRTARSAPRPWCPRTLIAKASTLFLSNREKWRKYPTFFSGSSKASGRSQPFLPGTVRRWNAQRDHLPAGGRNPHDSRTRIPE